MNDIFYRHHYLIMNVLIKRPSVSAYLILLMLCLTNKVIGAEFSFNTENCLKPPILALDYFTVAPSENSNLLT